jgi:hypothetical protein
MKCFNHHSLHDRKIKLSGAMSATRTMLVINRTRKKMFLFSLTVKGRLEYNKSE